VSKIVARIESNVGDLANSANRALRSWESMREFEKNLMQMEYDVDYELRNAVDRLVVTRLVSKRPIDKDTTDRSKRYGVYSGGSPLEDSLAGIVTAIQVISRPFKNANKQLDGVLASKMLHQGGMQVSWFPEEIKDTVDSAQKDSFACIRDLVAKMQAAPVPFKYYEPVSQADLDHVQWNTDAFAALSTQVIDSITAQLQRYTPPTDLLSNVSDAPRPDRQKPPQDMYFDKHRSHFKLTASFDNRVEDIRRAFSEFSVELAGAESEINARVYPSRLFSV
jgi:hypothetical protein